MIKVLPFTVCMNMLVDFILSKVYEIFVVQILRTNFKLKYQLALT